jgi:hypothetical protein
MAVYGSFVRIVGFTSRWTGFVNTGRRLRTNHRVDVHWQVITVDCELFCFNSFFAQQDDWVDSEGTPGGNQGGYETYAKHGKNDAAEDDRVLRRGQIHDRRKDTCCQYTEDHAS